jgi:hypothetical protein
MAGWNVMVPGLGAMAEGGSDPGRLHYSCWSHIPISQSQQLQSPQKAASAPEAVQVLLIGGDLQGKRSQVRKETPIPCWWVWKLVQALWKSVWRFSKIKNRTTVIIQ